MLHQCCRWTSRHPGDLATRAHRVSIQRAGDPLQPAEDHRGFLEPAPPWRRQLFLHRPDARILSLTSRLVPARGAPSYLLYNALYMAARRTQIYLTAEQRKRLDERRRRERRTLAELVRQAIDAYLADRSVDPATALNDTFGALPRLEVPSRNEWERA